MTIEEETRTLGPGDVVVVNRGQRHKVYSEEGVTFMEALAPVPLDHVPDQGLDLVLGVDGGAQHVEKVAVPLVRVELFERRLTPELESKLIERMTETLLEVLEAPELKEHTWVIVEGHDAHRWGRNAKPWDEA